ncbi:phospholipid phosphatase 3-like isoform X2 [Haliotis asinina]|uniref:phospholipid phosphatase 3-like isoform X2 n=1 Tax=Haliotis asinina TaxID=109174 RepID=UPI00353266B6
MVLLFIGALEKYGVPFRQGFFCDDDTIKYPYKQSTISVTLLMVVSLAVPLVVMVLSDAHFKVYKLRGTMTRHTVLRGVFNVALVFLFGGALTFIVTDIGKYSIGRLRPHFISVCHPALSTTCAEGYIQNYTCEGSDKQAISEARLSFPSGHASISFFGMTYFAVFLYARLPKSSPSLLKPFAMALVLSVAFYISLSRVFDYWHHPGDVIFGALLGASIAGTLSIFVARLPSTPDRLEADDPDRRKIVNLA